MTVAGTVRTAQATDAVVPCSRVILRAFGGTAATARTGDVDPPTPACDATGGCAASRARAAGCACHAASAHDADCSTAAIAARQAARRRVVAGGACRGTATSCRARGSTSFGRAPGTCPGIPPRSGLATPGSRSAIAAAPTASTRPRGTTTTCAAFIRVVAVAVTPVAVVLAGHGASIGLARAAARLNVARVIAFDAVLLAAAAACSSRSARAYQQPRPHASSLTPHHHIGLQATVG